MYDISINIIVAQIVGILAIIVFSLSPQQKTKVRVLIFQLTSSILYALQYLFLVYFRFFYQSYMLMELGKVI